MITSAALGAFECPYPLRIHPELAGVEDRGRAWAREVGLAGSGTDAARIARFRAGWFACAAWPSAARDLVDVVTDWTTWVLCVDDTVDQVPAGVGLWPTARLLLLSSQGADDPDSPPLDNQALLLAWQDINRRLRSILGAELYFGWQHAVREVFLGFLAAAARRTSGAVIPLGEYQALRAYDGAMTTNLWLLLPGAGLPAVAWTDPDVQRLVRCAGQIIGFTNDVFTIARDRYEDQQMGLPSALAAHHHVDLAEGLALAVHHIGGLYGRVAELAAVLRGAGRGPGLAEFVSRVEAHLSGHHHWYAVTGRYAPTQEEVPGDVGS
jgi:Terpene synthase family 2, C-terminal metal binding